MLLRWRKSITIALTPECIVMHSSGKEARVIELQSTMTEKASWLQGLAELEKSVVNIKSCRIRFILSNHYVRYAILPWQAEIYSRQDWQSLAENHLRSLHGNVVDNWKISVAMQGYGKPLVVSAIDQLLITRLEELAKQFDWVVESVEPALMSVSNHYRRKIKKNDWLMIVESQRILLAEIVKGYLVDYSIICPPTEQESTESIKLIRRTLKLNNKDVPATIHLFGNKKLQPKSDLGNIAMNSLVLNADKATMGLLLAELS